MVSRHSNSSEAASPTMVPACTIVGRILLWITALLVVVMPFTEYFCSFDRFLRGGDDAEFTLLAMLACFCLILAFFQQCTQGLNLILALRQWVVDVARHVVLAERQSSSCSAWLQNDPVPSPALGLFCLPIQV